MHWYWQARHAFQSRKAFGLTQKKLPQHAQKRMLHVVVGMSGGVDSSVAALLLKQQGFQVTGVYMKNWDPLDEDAPGVCTHESDQKDVEVVCRQLQIPLQCIDRIKSYWNNVFSPCLEHFESGTTPNPDVICNREIKFKMFIEYASSIGANLIATGHYARLNKTMTDSKSHSIPELYASHDRNKDQSYFLSQVPGNALQNVIFPLAPFLKPQVREIAKTYNLHTAYKKDSFGLCFVGKRDFRHFIHQYLPRQEGFFILVENMREYGSHEGFASYTVGQSAKLGGMETKYFVVGKRKRDHAVLIAGGARHPALYSEYFFVPANGFNWISGRIPPEFGSDGRGTLHCMYRVRHRQELAKCRVQLVSRQHVESQASTLSRDDSRGLEIESDQTDQALSYMRIDVDLPQRATTPGQALALYREDGMCFGGGSIGIVGKTYYELDQKLGEHVNE